MFGIGPMELIVIAIVAMVFIGPEKLPDLMRKFGKIFVQVRRQANDVKNSFNEVIHEAERDFELERIRELQRKLQATSPTQIIDAALADPVAAPLHGPGLDADGHPLPGFDENGYPLPGADHAVASSTDPVHEYHEGHYVDGKYVKPDDTFLAWDPSMDKPLHELFPLKPAEPNAAAETPVAAPAAAAVPTDKPDAKKEASADKAPPEEKT